MSQKVMRMVLHFCTFADLTFRFSMTHGEVNPVTKFKALKCKIKGNASQLGDRVIL